MKYGKLSDEFSHQPQPLLPLDQLLLQKEEDNESEFSIYRIQSESIKIIKQKSVVIAL